MYSYLSACWCVVCCYSSVAAAAACCRLLLLFAIVCRMAKFVPVVHCIRSQCFLSLHSNKIFLQYTPYNGITYTRGWFARAARLMRGPGFAVAAEKRDVLGVDHEVLLSIIVSSCTFEYINTTTTYESRLSQN